MMSRAVSFVACVVLAFYSLGQAFPVHSFAMVQQCTPIDGPCDANSAGASCDIPGGGSGLCRSTVAGCRCM